MRVGVPRILGFYYLFPLYREFLRGIGVDFVETPCSTPKDLDRMKLCPTDEPCVSVKIAFSHAEKLLVEDKVEALFVPSVVSLDQKNYCCPKMMGLPYMLRAGLDLEPEKVISPVIDFKDNPGCWQKTWMQAASKLGVKDRGLMRRALERGLLAWKESESAMSRCRLSILDLLEKREGVLEVLLRKEALSGFKAFGTAGVKEPVVGPGATAILGHAYVLHDLFGRKILEMTRAFGPIVLPEMVSPEDARQHLATIFEGEKMWAVEGHILGSGLFLARNRLVSRMIMVSAFSCGPASIIENYLSRAAEDNGIPFLSLTVDEHTGEAGLVTRLEAFLDSCGKPFLRKSLCVYRLEPARKSTIDRYSPSVPGSVSAGPVGAVNMGTLNIPVASLLRSCGVDVALPGPLSDAVVTLGKELAPEFICYPMVALLGQMRELIHRGVDRIIMVQGKGRCRLGWYAQVMQELLTRAGYRVRILAVDSPFPWKEKGQFFLQVVREIVGSPGPGDVVRGATLAISKLFLLDWAQDVLREVRAREEERGLGERRYKEFLREMENASGVLSAVGCFRKFVGDMRGIRRVPGEPLRVSVVGEIYVVNEPYVNKDVERILGSFEQRVRVYRRLDVTGWVNYHLLKAPGAVLDYRLVTKAAEHYIPVSVGGHGQETVGEVVMAKRRGMDGVIHLFPFTCMPEIIAQNILVKVSRDLQLPVLSLVISEQTGVAGLTTRLEAFCDLLAGRRKEKAKRHERGYGS